MNSLYAALLQAQEEEALGSVDPSLAVNDSATVPEPEVAEAPEPVATPVVPPTAAPAKRSLADELGVDMPQATPEPRTANRQSLIANIGRAGNTISSAIGGIKNDSSFYDGMEKGGLDAAHRQDKSNDDLTSFKQKVLLARDNERQAKAKAAPDPELSDRNSPKYKQLKAEYNSTEEGKIWWASLVKENGGIEPDLNNVGTKPDRMLPRDTSIANSKRNEDAGYLKQERAFAHAKTMENLRWGHSLDRMGLDEELRLARDQRDAFIPDRPFFDPNQPPTTQSAGKVRENDALTNFVLPAIARLKEKILSEKGDWRAIPGLNGEITSLQQAISTAMLKANGYGVPTGNDWAMLLKELGDPTRLRDVFTGAEGDQINEAAHNIQAKNAVWARSHGYGEYKLGSGNKVPSQKPIDVVRRNIRPPGAAVPAATGPESAVQVEDNLVTPSGKPYAKKAKKKGTEEIHYFNAAGDRVE